MSDEDILNGKEEIEYLRKSYTRAAVGSTAQETKGAIPSTVAIVVRETKAQKEINDITRGQKTKKQPTHRLYRPNTKKLKGGKVTISPGLIWYLKLHARRWKPAESCAMLIGFKDDKAKKFDIRGAVICSNPTHSSGYFEMPPMEVVRCFDIAEKHGMEIVGVYHSHPSGFEIPSSTDENFMEITPGAWIIYSWTAMRCYTLKKDRWQFWQVKELTLEEIKTEAKPIIEYAYDWKTTKFPPKPKPFVWKSSWYKEPVLPINVNANKPVWPPYFKSMYGVEEQENIYMGDGGYGNMYY